MKPTLYVDSSPFIRPLLEFMDDFETSAVLVADNNSAKVFLITALNKSEEQSIKGEVKNAVKVGGWSQQRYRRRRDGELKAYAKEIAKALQGLERDHSFRRLLMVGGKEILRAVQEQLPGSLRRKQIDTQALDLSKGEAYLEEELFNLFVAQERASEEALWQRIREAWLSDGLALVGPKAVLRAAAEGRVHRAVAIRSLQLSAVRCRSCEALSPGEPQRCPSCKTEDLFRVDLLNECGELLLQSGADLDFVDPNPQLAELGGMAALLRY